MPAARPDRHRGRVGDRKDQSNDRDRGRDRDRDRNSGSSWWDKSSSSHQDDKYQGQWKQGYSNNSEWFEPKKDWGQWGAYSPVATQDLKEKDIETVIVDDAEVPFTQLLSDTRSKRGDKDASANAASSSSQRGDRNASANAASSSSQHRDEDDRRSSGSLRSAAERDRRQPARPFKDRWNIMDEESTARDDTVHCTPKAMAKPPAVPPLQLTSPPSARSVRSDQAPSQSQTIVIGQMGMHRRTDKPECGTSLRRDPEDSCTGQEPECHLASGELVKVVEHKDPWTRVSTLSKVPGWPKARFVHPAPADSTRPSSARSSSDRVAPPCPVPPIDTMPRDELRQLKEKQMFIDPNFDVRPRLRQLAEYLATTMTDAWGTEPKYAEKSKLYRHHEHGFEKFGGVPGYDPRSASVALLYRLFAINQLRDMKEENDDSKSLKSLIKDCSHHGGVPPRRPEDAFTETPHMSYPSNICYKEAFSALSAKVQKDYEGTPEWENHGYMISQLGRLNDSNIGDLFEANLAVAYYVHCQHHGVPWVAAEIRGGVHIPDDRTVTQSLWYLGYEEAEMNCLWQPPPSKKKRVRSASPCHSSVSHAPWTEAGSVNEDRSPSREPDCNAEQVQQSKSATAPSPRRNSKKAESAAAATPRSLKSESNSSYVSRTPFEECFRRPDYQFDTQRFLDHLSDQIEAAIAIYTTDKTPTRDTDKVMYNVYVTRLRNVERIVKRKHWHRLDELPMGKIRPLISQVQVFIYKAIHNLDPAKSNQQESGAILQLLNSKLRSHILDAEFLTEQKGDTNKKHRILEPEVEAQLKRERKQEVHECKRALTEAARLADELHEIEGGLEARCQVLNERISQTRHWIRDNRTLSTTEYDLVKLARSQALHLRRPTEQLKKARRCLDVLIGMCEDDEDTQYELREELDHLIFEAVGLSYEKFEDAA